MVDFENLSEWPVDKLISARGFKCERCGMMEAVAYSTVSLDDKLRKLLRYEGHPKFVYYFKTTLRKAEGVNLRGETVYGTLRRKDMASDRPLG